MSRPNLVIDNCESVADWTIFGDDTTNLATTTNHVSGTKSIEFDKANGGDNTKIAGADRALASLDLLSHDPDQLFYNFVADVTIYQSDKTNIDYGFIRIGTDAANYAEYRFSDTYLVDGKFARMRTMLKNAFVTGTGCDWSAIDYLAVGVAFDAEANALADIAVDNISISRVEQSVAATVE